jgi:hypothetical protein
MTEMRVYIGPATVAELLEYVTPNQGYSQAAFFKIDINRELSVLVVMYYRAPLVEVSSQAGERAPQARQSHRSLAIDLE